MYRHYVVRRSVSWPIGGWVGEAILDEGGRLQSGCIAVAIESHLVFIATYGRH